MFNNLFLIFKAINIYILQNVLQIFCFLQMFDKINYCLQTMVQISISVKETSESMKAAKSVTTYIFKNQSFRKLLNDTIKIEEYCCLVFFLKKDYADLI